MMTMKTPPYLWLPPSWQDIPLGDAATRPLITSLLTIHGPDDDHPLHLFPIVWDVDAEDWVVTVDKRVLYDTGSAAASSRPTLVAKNW